MLNLSARWRWVINAMSQLLYSWEGAPVTIVQKDGWASGPAWIDM